MGKKKKNKGLLQSSGREWFDKDYTAREVYGRLWGFARRYRRLIFLGAFLGMVTGGAWVPIFSAIQPMLQQLQADVPQDEVYAQLTESVAKLEGAAAAGGQVADEMERQPEGAAAKAGQVRAQAAAVAEGAGQVAEVAKGFAPKDKQSKLERQSAAEAAK